MRNHSKILVVAVTYSLTLLLSCSPSFAGVGKTGGQFLKISPSARSAAMAGVSAGLADVFTLYSNPAGLGELKQAELAATFLQYFGDVNYGYIGYASKVRNKGVFGFSYTYLVVSDLQKMAADESSLGTFNARDISLMMAYGKSDVAPAIMENLSLGASVKIISSEIDQTIAYAAAADLAAMCHPAENLSAALVLQNISPGIKFKDVTDQLPLNLKLGVTYASSERSTLGAEIDEYLIDNKVYAAVGGEYWIVPQLALRLGYRYGYDTASLGSSVGLGGGFGFRIWSAGLDYAFVPYGDLGDTHRISFTTKF